MPTIARVALVLLLATAVPTAVTARPHQTHCPAGLTAVGAGLCTHGPDRKAVMKSGKGKGKGKPAPLTCVGDGQDGPRVQVLHLRADTQMGRYDKANPPITRWLGEVDAAFLEGGRRVRWVTDAGCVPVVPVVTVPQMALVEFADTITTLQGMGYDREDRIYVLFTDAERYCGIGNFEGDEQPGPDNASNIGPAYARVDAPCWSAQVAAHELLHTLGAVNLSAPHTSGGAHCLDGYDIMCYSDPPNFPTVRIVCPPPASSARTIDCNHDDYFDPSPPAGSYLATSWNTANNVFLTGAP